MNRRRRWLAGAAVGALALVAVPLPAAAAAACEPAVQVPEVPGGTFLLIVGALTAAGALTVVRRARIASAALGTLTVVLVAGVALGAVTALAATTGCDPSVPGQVLGTSAAATGTPLTGADIPWAVGFGLVLVGLGITVAARARRPTSDGRAIEGPPAGSSLSVPSGNLETPDRIVKSDEDP